MNYVPDEYAQALSRDYLGDPETLRFRMELSAERKARKAVRGNAQPRRGWFDLRERRVFSILRDAYAVTPFGR